MLPPSQTCKCYKPSIICINDHFWIVGIFYKQNGVIIFWNCSWNFKTFHPLILFTPFDGIFFIKKQSWNALWPIQVNSAFDVRMYLYNLKRKNNFIKFYLPKFSNRSNHLENKNYFRLNQSSSKKRKETDRYWKGNKRNICLISFSHSSRDIANVV